MSYELSGTAPRRARSSLRGFDPIEFANRLQAGANRLTANLNTAAGRLQDAQRKLNVTIDAVTGATMTTGQVVQSVSRAGIATAVTGDSSSGLLGAAASTKPIYIIAGIVAAWFVFAKHPGKRGL